MEGDPGTWSFCGNRKPHSSHTHTIVVNEGPYHGVVCNGVRVKPSPVYPEPKKDLIGEKFYEVFTNRLPDGLAMKPWVMLSKDEKQSYILDGMSIWEIL